MTEKPTGRTGDERGLSLIEVTVVLLLLVLVAAILYELVLGVTRASMFTESRNDVAAIGQRVVNSIQRELIQSKLVLQENSTGAGYRTLFANALPAGVSVWSNSRMPILDSNTSLISPDPGPNSISNRTGNSMIVVRQLTPLAIPYDHDNNAGTPNINFMADRYQFQYYFLRQNTSRSFGGFGYYLELMQAKSQTFADYFQLSTIPVNGSQVIMGLRAQSPSITMAWNPGKAVNAPAFYNLNAMGTLMGNFSPTFSVTTASMTPEFAGGRISGKMEYSVGLNASTPLAVSDPIPMYATANANFPGGAEFMVVGPAGSRKVLTRLVLVAESMRQISSRESVVITSARGF